MFSNKSKIMDAKSTIHFFCKRHHNFARFIVNLYLICPIISKKNREEIVETIAEFKRYKPDIDYLKSNKLLQDMLYSKIVFDIRYDQYFLYDFYRKNDLGRIAFVSEAERTLLQDKYNSECGREKLRDKEECYKIFNNFYGRELLKINDEDEGDLECFTAFIKKHPHFMVKPCYSEGGMGVRKVDYIGERSSCSSLLHDILKDGSAVLEEVIFQCDELKKYHPNSVNTVRVLTFLNDKDETAIIFTVLRMGCGESIVDNGAAGGIIADVDISSGTIVSNGFRENGESFFRHPDSNVIFLGSKIPKWDELIDIVKQLAPMIPEARLVGWDMALTDEGWIMVEANCCPSFTIWQMCVEYGAKNKIEKIVGRIDA